MISVRPEVRRRRLQVQQLARIAAAVLRLGTHRRIRQVLTEVQLAVGRAHNLAGHAECREVMTPLALDKALLPLVSHPDGMLRQYTTRVLQKLAQPQGGK